MAAASRPPTPPFPPRRRRPRREFAGLLVGLTVLYLSAAYLAVPAAWKRYARRHPSLADVPDVTHTGAGIPADPINVSLVGTKPQVLRSMLDANWYPADPLTLRSSLEIAGATVFRRRYDDAPVSSLYLFGRKEDLAFEQPAGRDPRKRHHVRFWRSEKVDPDGRPVWLGAATFDVKVGFSHRTGQITHHTGADIDAERNLLFADLQRTGQLSEVYLVKDFREVREGRNGGGDRWRTDGNLWVGVIRADVVEGDAAKQPRRSGPDGLTEQPSRDGR